MDTNTHSVRQELHEFYIAKINNVIAEGRESLISGLVADYEKLSRAESESTDKAA